MRDGFQKLLDDCFHAIIFFSLMAWFGPLSFTDEQWREILPSIVVVWCVVFALYFLWLRFKYLKRDRKEGESFFRSVVFGSMLIATAYSVAAFVFATVV